MGLLLPVIGKYTLFGPALVLQEPFGGLKEDTPDQKVGKFLALRLELG